MRLAQLHLSKTLIAAGGAALSTESHKRAKYLKLSVAHIFAPVAVETLGAWGRDACQLVSELGRRDCSGFWGA